MFYFSSAGKEAWVKNPNISFETEKISYSLTNNEGAVLGTAAIGDVPTIDESKFMQTGKQLQGTRSTMYHGQKETLLQNK